MTSIFSKCLSHMQPEQVIVRKETSVKLICRQCCKKQKRNQPNIILNEQSKLFFIEWTRNIIEKYSSIIQSLDRNNSQDLFQISYNLNSRVPKAEMNRIIREIINSQIEVHNGNQQFIKNTHNLGDLLNQFFMNDLLNIFSEPAASNMENLVKMLDSGLKCGGYASFQGEIKINNKLTSSLDLIKLSIKNKYLAHITIQNGLSIETKQKNFVNINKIKQNETPKKIAKSQETNNQTIKKAINNISPNMPLNIEPKNNQSFINQNLNTISSPIAESPKSRELKIIIDRLQQQNEHLKQWKSEIEGYLDTMSQKIGEISPKQGKTIQLNVDYSQQQPQSIKGDIEQKKTVILNLQQKILLIQKKAQQYKQEKQDLAHKVAELGKVLQQSSSKLYNKEMQLIQAHNIINNNKISSLARQKECQRLKKQLDLKIIEIQKHKSALIASNNKFDKIEKQNTKIKAQKTELQSQLSKFVTYNQSLTESIKQYKSRLQNQNEAINVNSPFTEIKGAIQNTEVSHLAQQIKDKMNKINNLMRSSSSPSLSKKKSKQKIDSIVQINKKISKNLQKQRVSQNSGYSNLPIDSIVERTDLNDNLHNLEQQINHKNKQIWNLSNNNKQLLALSKELQSKIAELENNSGHWVQELQRKISQNQQAIANILKQKNYYEQEVQKLKGQINDVLMIRDQMEAGIENKQKIIEMLNEKIANIQRELESKNQQNGQALNEELLEEVIEYEAQIQRKKQNLRKVLTICNHLLSEIRKQNFAAFQNEIKIIQQISRKQL